jgi:hypothetical protein
VAILKISNKIVNNLSERRLMPGQAGARYLLVCAGAIASGGWVAAGEPAR